MADAIGDELGEAEVSDKGLAVGAEEDVAGLDVVLNYPRKTRWCLRETPCK